MVHDRAGWDGLGYCRQVIRECWQLGMTRMWKAEGPRRRGKPVREGGATTRSLIFLATASTYASPVLLPPDVKIRRDKYWSTTACRRRPRPSVVIPLAGLVGRQVARAQEADTSNIICLSFLRHFKCWYCATAVQSTLARFWGLLAFLFLEGKKVVPGLQTMNDQQDSTQIALWHALIRYDSA